MASVKEFYLKALVTAKDKLSPALKNIAKQADTSRASLGRLDRISESVFVGVSQAAPAAAKQFRMVRAETAKLGSRLGAVMKRLAVIGAVSYGAGRGIYSLVSGAAEAGDALQKMSIRTVTSVEAIQEWRFAADRSGISAETFENNLRPLFLSCMNSLGFAQNPRHPVNCQPATIPGNKR